MKRQRGYTLIEAAIVLAAFLVLTSSLGWLFAQRIRTETATSELDYMQALRESVVTYAIRNRTAGVEVTLHFSPSSIHSMQVPQGRPYLPCPDTDGDGIEDRNDPAVSPVNLTVDVAGSSISVRFDLQLEGSPGACESNRGLLPWRTLGTKPADHWGQHYSFAVDPMLANGLFGFDATSDAASYASLIAVRRARTDSAGRPTGQRCKSADRLPRGIRDRPTNYASPESRNSYGYIGVSYGLGSPPHLRNVPSVVGSPPDPRSSPAPTVTIGVDDLVLAGGFHNALYVDTASDRRRVYAKPFAGKGRTVPGERIVVRRYCWTDYDALTGVAFAVISHGQNGYGGATYEPSRDAASICRSIIGGTRFEDYTIWERLNALNNVNVCGNNGDDNRSFDLLVSYNDAFHSTDFAFDDLLVWMMPSEVFGRMAEAEALPETPPVLVVDL